MGDPTGQRHLLVVEDNPEDVVLFRKAIERTGVTLPYSHAGDGQQAIDYLKGAGEFSDRSRHPFPSLVLLDLRMPKKSGHEVLSWMKEHRLDHPKVVVFTSSSEPRDIEQAMKSGAFAYIVKPMSLAVLGNIVKDLAAALASSDRDHLLLGWHVRPIDR